MFTWVTNFITIAICKKESIRIKTYESVVIRKTTVTIHAVFISAFVTFGTVTRIGFITLCVFRTGCTLVAILTGLSNKVTIRNYKIDNKS